MCSLRFCTKNRVDVEGVHRLNEHTDAVAEHLAQSLVHLPGVALGPNRVAKLALYHREGRLYVASHVVVLHEGQSVVHEVVVHLRPYWFKDSPFGGCA
jgi:hypothetical protein